MTKKENYLLIGLGILSLAVLIPLSIYLYIVFAIPERVYAYATYDGNLKITTEPSDLLQKGKISRFTMVYLTLENQTKATCKGVVRAKPVSSVNDLTNFDLGPKDSSTSGSGGLYRPQDDGKIVIEICGKSETLKLR